MPKYHEVLSHFLLYHWLCQWNWDLPQNVIVLWANISADEENKIKSQNQITTMCTAWTTARKSYPVIVVLNLLSGHQCGQKLVIILTQPLSLHLLFARNGEHKPCNNLGPWTTASQDMGCSAWFRIWPSSPPHWLSRKRNQGHVKLPSPFYFINRRCLYWPGGLMDRMSVSCCRFSWVITTSVFDFCSMNLFCEALTLLF